MKKRSYRAYVLRCWQNGHNEDTRTFQWHFSLEEILHERRRQGFDDLDALIEFLREQFNTHLKDEDGALENSKEP